MAVGDDLDPGRFYSVAALADRWGAHPRTVRNKINAGELRARRIGRRWAVHGSVIRDYEAGSDFAREVPAGRARLRPA